jgi:Lipocalin-like domain
MPSNPLIGTWRLVIWHNRTSDGSTSHPMGADAVGLIGYSEDGYMFAQIASAGRSNFSTNDLAGGSLEEDSAAMKSIIAYAGPYDFRGDYVLHRVQVASFPNWVGTAQKRHVNFEGERLRLSTDPLSYQGEEITAHLLWERVPTV